MGIANCPECGKIYMENPTKMCPACYAVFEENEQKVVEFLRKKRKASLEEIHKGTGVAQKIILRMVRQNRLMSDFQIEYPCETCGAPIVEGRLCEACARNVLGQLKPQAPEPENKPAESKTQKMHIGERFQR
ncbi:MAG: YvyF: flagellar operon protein [Firmicutes bacterium]|nr:YvyF: flagellar operon protein [Bacillota bacterium]